TGRRSGSWRAAWDSPGRSVCGDVVERSQVLGEAIRARHECEVAERLREVADLLLLARQVFLGEQPDVVAQPGDALEQLPAVFLAADHAVDVREPERAREEHAFLTAEA